jgi:hypothetical protein
LRGGLASPRLDDDVRNAAAGASKTCWISGRGVRPTFSPFVPTQGSSPPPPSQSDVTYARRSCLDESVGNLPSARGCFDQRSLAIDPVCRGTASRCGEGIMRGGDKGGKVAPLSTSPSPKDVDPGEASIPHLFAARPTVRQSLSLSSCAHVSSLEACLALRLATSEDESASHGSPRPPLMSYPISRKRERSLHTCAQDVQITRMSTI